MFDPPNLDGIDNPKELEAIAQVLHTLAFYARKKATAIRTRLSGEINIALKSEKNCDRLYNKLPQWARW